jgi:hypothetical protein
MAILVHFQKVREDELEVEYTFGYPTMDRRLIIHKATVRGRPLDGEEDIHYRSAVMGIFKRQHAETTWPDGGVWAS